MTCEEKAAELRAQGHNCCQAVLGTCCEKVGLDPKTAYRLGAFFNGGMRQGEVCGAVSAVLMALGLQYGDENNRQCEKSTEFLNAFQKAYGALRCWDLVGKDGSGKKEICPGLIFYCAEYLEKEFKE